MSRSAEHPLVLDGPDRLRDLLAERGGRAPAAEALAAALAAGGTRLVAAPVGTDPAALHLPDPVAAVVLPDRTGGPTAVHAAALLVEAGVPVVVTVACADRNRVAIEGALAACADIGVAGVLCVEGEHGPGTVHDLAPADVAVLARRAGLLALALEPLPGADAVVAVEALAGGTR
jgi:methylenetetrahydrofolate reductase (NADPH)